MKKIVKTLCLAFLCGFLGACSLTPSSSKPFVRVALCQQSLLEGIPDALRNKFPDVEFEFTLSQNTAKYYEYLNEHDDLPDILTVRRFSLLDSLGLKDSLVDLSTSEIASSYYQNYLTSYTYEDGTINWLPTLAEVWVIVANKTLFDENNIEIPTDYASFVDACQKFEDLGIQGFSTDWKYDYSSLETLEGFNIDLLQSLDAKNWRSSYESGMTDTLDDTVWPQAFEHLYQVLKDTKNLESENPRETAVLDQGFSYIQENMKDGKIAMIRSSAAEIVGYQDSDKYEYILLPYFGETSDDNWLLTYPNYQAAMKKDSDVDEDLLMEIYEYLLGEECQEILGTGSNVLSYSAATSVNSNEYLQSLNDLIEQNKIYIRLANDDFFNASKVAVQGMISGEYDAKQAYEAFNESLKNDLEVTNDLNFDTSYEYTFTSDSGSESSSAILNTCRDVWGTDLAVTFSVCISNSVYEGDFASSNMRYLYSANPGASYYLELTGEQVTNLVSSMLTYQGEEDGSKKAYIPKEENLLPVSSGFEMDITKKDGAYTLNKLTIDGKEIENDKTYSIIFSIPSIYVMNYANAAGIEIPEDAMNKVDGIDGALKTYFAENDQLKEPSKYITLK